MSPPPAFCEASPQNGVNHDGAAEKYAGHRLRAASMGLRDIVRD
jgi:hypothetical protein